MTFSLGSVILGTFVALGILVLVVLPVTEHLVTNRSKRMARAYSLSLSTEGYGSPNAEMHPLIKKLREKYPDIMENKRQPGWVLWFFSWLFYILTFGYVNWLSSWVSEVSIEKSNFSSDPPIILKFKTWWPFNTSNADIEIKRHDQIPDCFPQVLALLEERALRNAGLVAQSLAQLSDAAHNPDFQGALSLPMNTQSRETHQPPRLERTLG